MRRVTLSVLVGVLALGVAGCGGSRSAIQAGGHTYVLVPSTNQSVLPPTDLYLTIVSPVAIPASVLRSSNARLVAHAAGRQDCSYTKAFDGLPGKAAYLNGRTVTLKVNGSNPITAVLCSVLNKGRTFRPTSINGQ